MIDKILDFDKLGGDYYDLVESVRVNVPCTVFGMTQIEKVLLATSSNKKILYLTCDVINAKRVYEFFKQIVGNRVGLFPEGSDVLMYKKAQSNENNVERLKTVFGLCTGTIDVVVASIDAVFSYLPNLDRFIDNILNLKIDDDISFDSIRQSLFIMGYTEESIINAPGQFAIRGDILDVFPVNSKNPYRVDFFDTNVEQIKVFDILTQSSKESVKEIFISPYTNLFLDEKEINELINQLEKIKPSYSRIDVIDDLITKLSTHNLDFSLDYLFPLLEDKLSNIFDYLSPDTLVVIDECKMVFDAFNGYSQEIVTRYKMIEKSGEVIGSATGFIPKQTIFDKINSFKRIAHQRITTSNNFFQTQAIYSFKSIPISRYTHNSKALAEDLNVWLTNGFNVLLFCKDDKGVKSIGKILASYDIYIDPATHISINSPSSALLPYELTTGFVLPSRKLVVIGTYDMMPKVEATKRISSDRKDVFSVPKVGDYVVHSIHGIGLCEGVSKLTGNFGTKDYIVVKYRDDDKLYVPIDQMDLLDRFSGAETPKRLSKIGGVEFGHIKEKVKASVKKMAFDLLELYAKRDAKKGFIYSKDNLLQKEFENSFPYTETEDQLISLSEIKADMESGKVMDRLLCGDVGFGKTEVALRTAFKAILDTKQVAFLAPTTILAEQHFNTCKKRFENFGINIACLNRFKLEKDKKEVIEKLENGKIDIVCGTHRLLSKDVVFKNLGLVILDEEQKFGVEDKEKIKIDNENVDILTLSATPIPRTLNMSLSGIRDISVIQTPPSDRLPVQTYVTEYSESLVRDAIQKEMSRGGQVFFLYNRVETIYAFAEKIRKIVPEAKILVAHGQLAGSELENVIYEFYNKMADVLICTTIIENGIDLPNANTLIVYDADKFGLSQLYQIRGRVGRSSRMAYAYFTYNYDKVLSEDAYKRLEAISEFTEFGSGFKIAMRDLEIRGSGNILGAEQHGHLQKVGYDMYCKLLNEAIKEIKGKKVEEEKSVLVKVDIDAYISEKYISDSETRMKVYRNISHIDSIESKIKVERELLDVFGTIPSPTQNLIEIAWVKYLAKTIGIEEILSQTGKTQLILEQNTELMSNSWFADAIFKYKDICYLDMSQKPIVNFDTKGKTNIQSFEIIKNFLNIATNMS